jgi:GT2 family glycosyltransferase
MQDQNESWTNLYRQANALAELERWEEAATLLQTVCRMVPNHASAHHLLGKARGQQGDLEAAETHQRRSCTLDPQLGWNWFALGELLEQRETWTDAASCYRLASQALPHEGWIEELAIRTRQRSVLGGDDLSQGLSPKAYRHWCEQLEPRFPSELVPVRQSWWIHPRGQERSSGIPPQGWVVVLGEACSLRPRALQAIEAWLAARPIPAEPDLLTADEDRVDACGCRTDPWFKPAVLKESFWAQPWLDSLSIWRCGWLRSQDLGWPPADDEARLEWLWTALGRQPQQAHMPAVLVHQRADVEPPDRHRMAQVLLRHLHSQGEKVEAISPANHHPSGFQISWAVPKGLRCTAIVPTRNQAALLQQCLSSVEASLPANGVELEWIVVDNGSDQPELARCLIQWRQRLGERFRVIQDDQPFNWSALNNRAATQSDADLLLFLNNDIEAYPAAPDWLNRMASQAMRPAVGCAGAVLLYPDGTLQHAGVVIGMHGGADHAYRGLSPDHAVHRGRSRLLSDWGAVTGAALMVRRALFEQFGGFDPQLPVEFNDVDFCLRLGQQGYRHVIDPAVILVHHESQSRDALGSTTAARALQHMQARWPGRLSSTAPWWPQACSEERTDGRPRELNVVR